MAEITDSDSNTKTLQIQEQVEGDRVETDDYYFCKVGEAIPLMSDGSIIDADNAPSKPLVISQQHGLIFAAHSSGFCVAKTKDVVAAAKEIKEKGSGSSVQELSVVDVPIGRVSILDMSIDSSLVSAVVGREIHCFMVDSLLNKDKESTFSCSVESDHVKDMLWIKDMEPSFIVLTDNGNLHLGAIKTSIKSVMDEVDAVGRSVDGNVVAVGRRHIISFYTSKFKELSQILLPLDTWTGESDTIKVDSIKWVRSDSILVGCFQQNEDGKEENYFIRVIRCKNGQFIDDSPWLASVDFSDLFCGIVDDIVPCGSGPHLCVDYMENCKFAFVSNRKNTDEHIMLFDWSQVANQVSVVDIGRDSWLPRIELQENGDDNLVLGLAVEKSSVYENVKVKIGVEEERELPPLCLLVCLTLEGRLVMFKVASISGSQRSSQALPAASSNAQSTSVVGFLDVGQAPLQLEEERAKQSVMDLRVNDSGAMKNSSAVDEVLVGKEQKAVVDVNNSMPFEYLGQSREGTLNQFSFKNLEEGLSAFAGDSVKTEKWKIERDVSLTDKSLEKSLTSTRKGLEAKIGSSELNKSSTPTTSGSSLGSSVVSDPKCLFSSPEFSKSLLTSTGIAKSSGSFLGNFGSCPSDSFNSSGGKTVNQSQKLISSSGLSGPPITFPSSKMQQQESGNLQNFIGQSVHQMLGNDKKSSPLGKLNAEQNLPKQFSNVQNMAKELDKLLESIEAAGGIRDVCTTAHKRSIEALEEGIDDLADGNRVWQSRTEEQLGEIQLLLDKTVQVLARKTHIEGIFRQTTDGQYWDLWNRQNLNSELEQKRRSALTLSQDLINRMIELEKHFNTLELNLYGESTGANLVSRSLNSRSAPSRHNESLHAIHNATISQLAAAKQLSDSLSKQMAVLSIKSSPTNKANVRKQVFESIGIPYPDETLRSPNTVKVMDSPSNRPPLVSYSGETQKDSSRVQLSSASSHDLETARRRRDSLDRNWANFEAPKTTVKRTVIQNDHQKISGLFSSMDKQFVSPGKLEGSAATYSKILAVEDGSGHRDAPQKITSDITATSKYKWSGGITELSQAVIEQPPKWQLLQGDSFSAIQNMSSSSSTSSSITSAFVDPNMKKGIIHLTAERRGTQMGNIDRSVIAPGDRNSSVLQIGEEKFTPQKIQPQLFSSPIKGGQMPNFSAKETVSTKPVVGQSFSHMSTSNQSVESSPSTVFSPIKGGQTPFFGGKETELMKPGGGQSFSDVSTIKHSVESSPSTELTPVCSASLHNLSMQTLPLNSVEGGSTTSTKMAQVFNKEVLQFPPSAISVSSSFAAPVSSVTPRNSKEVSELLTSVISVSASQAAPIISVSSKGTEIVYSESTVSFVKPAKEPLKLGPPTATNKASVGNNLATTQFPEKPSPSSNEGLNFSELTPSSTEFPGALASCPDTNKIVSAVSGMVSNTPAKQSTAVTPSPISTSQPGGAAGGKSDVDATVAQEDEMEEEAPETNQTVDLSLGSLAGFGLGSASSAAVPKSNPFGCSITSAPQTMPSSISLTVQSGELFRPATFNFQSPQACQPSQSPGGGFSFTNPLQQNTSGSGFGQQSQIGSGQQALGSVLGSFGQSRQIGGSLPGSGFGASQSPAGGFLNAGANGGFAGIGSTTSGFGSGFAAVATGGGFAAAAPTGGGFASAVPRGGGFAGAAPSGGGFSAATPSGGFGVGAGGRQPPLDLFTQIRK